LNSTFLFNFSGWKKVMPTHKSAEKRVRQTERRRTRNRQVVSATRTYVKKVRAAISEGNNEQVSALLKDAVKALDKAVTKGVMNRNAASRKISRLTLAVNGSLA
jgi:small subunit ribosomal protein S20